MKKLSFLFAFISVFAFGQETEFTPSTHFIVEVNQDFGNIIATDSLHEIKDPSLRLAGTSFKITASIKTKSGMFIEPYFQSTVLGYYSECQFSNSETQYVYVDNSSRVGYYFGEGSEVTSNLYALGFNLQKRISKYFSIGGGFQLQYRVSEFIDYVTVFGQIKNNSGVFEDVYNQLSITTSNSKSFNYAIPIISRVYLPVGESKAITISGSVLLGNRAYASAGIGFSF